MTDEDAFRLGKRAVRLIKEGNFDLDSWQEIYDKINSKDILNLVSALRNALSYGTENGKIRGLVKAGYMNALDEWKNVRTDQNSEIAVIGDRAVKVAGEYIKKNRIQIE